MHWAARLAMALSKTNVTVALIVVGGAIWCVPLVIGGVLIFDQYQQGTGSIFLIEFGILPYAAALTINVVGPSLLLRFRNENQALALSAVMLVSEIPIVLFWILGLGST
jgi:hypothetical protein